MPSNASADGIPSLWNCMSVRKPLVPIPIDPLANPGGPLAERMIYGAGRLYASTLNKGESYSELKPAVLIWLLRDQLPHRHRSVSEAVCEYRFRDSRGSILGKYPVIVVMELKN